MDWIASVFKDEKRFHFFFGFLILVHLVLGGMLFWAGQTVPELHPASIYALCVSAGLIGCTDLLLVYWLRSRIQAEVAGLGEHDPVTQCYSPRVLVRRLKEEVSLAERYSEFFSLAYIAFDGDDTRRRGRSRPLGSVALRNAARLLRSTVRTEDCLARVKGDEFVMLMPRTDSRSARLLSARLAHTFEETPISAGFGIKTRAKLIISTVTYPLHSQDAEELLSMSRVTLNRSGDLIPQMMQ